MAWLGMVLTHPGHRRNGYARRLVQHVLHRARTLAIPTVKLDATQQGQPVYESFGFRPERTLHRWLRNGSDRQELWRTHSCMPRRDSSRRVPVLDAKSYGYDRTKVLHALAVQSTVFTEPDAYLFLRPGRTACYLGPFVAKDATSAAELATTAMGHVGDSACFWDIFSDNREAVALAEAYGFIPQRALTRMALGEESPDIIERIYGIAGFEIG